MRALLLVAVLAIGLGGCASAPAPTTPSTTSSTPPPTQSAAPTTGAVACHYGATAIWREPGLFLRAQNASFVRRIPDPGIPVNEPRLVEAYETVNLTRVLRQGPGETGKLRSLNFVATPKAVVVGNFDGSTSTEERKQEFLAFARPLFAADEAKLQGWAEEFANSAPTLPDRSGHGVNVTGPYRIDEFLAGAGSNAALRATQARVVIWEKAGWSAELYVVALHYVENKPGLPEPIQVNHDDWVELFVAGAKTRAEAWASANQTFEARGWPRPDLSSAHVSCS